MRQPVVPSLAMCGHQKAHLVHTDTVGGSTMHRNRHRLAITQMINEAVGNVMISISNVEITISTDKRLYRKTHLWVLMSLFATSLLLREA